MRIILEGIDGSGKSSIAKDLSRDLKLTIHWPGGPPGDDNKEVIKRCVKQYLYYNSIFDRVTCISEQCYRYNISRTRSIILNSYLNLMLNGSIIIYCTAQAKEETNDGFNDKDHNKYVKDNFEIINNKYKKLMLMTPHIEYNFQTMRYEDLLCSIKKLLFIK